MSSLKKMIRRILGKKDDPRDLERKFFERERRKKLKENGVVFLSEHQIRTREGLNFRLQDDVDGGTDIFVIEEVFCDPDYAFKIDESEKTVVLDMGMNIGAASLYFAALENVAHVYSFEPFAPTYRRALENIKLNPPFDEKISTFNIGLGKENQTLEIPYCNEISGNMSTTIDRLENDEKYRGKNHVLEKVEVKNAAEAVLPIFDSLTTERVVLKIDTEGAEFDILESLDSASLLQKVDFIMMEFHFRSPRPLEDILTRNGFVVIYRHFYHEAIRVGVMYAANIGRKKPNG